MNIEEANELLAKFIGYSRKVVSYEEKVWNSSNEYYWSWIEGELWVNHNDVPIDDESDQLKFHYDWNELMKVVDKIRSYPGMSKQFENEKIGAILIDRFEIGKFGMFLQVWKRTENGWKDTHSYHMFVPDNPLESDCKSYMETIYKSCIDFVKFVNSND